MEETNYQRAERILAELQSKYPGKNCFDLDGRAMHFVCEIEPTAEHTEYDRAVEVMIATRPHKHLKMTQHYTVLKGTLALHLDDQIITLHPNEQFIVEPNHVHWATSDDECWVELYSQPGWTKEDHILVEA
jgi:mannose-6-phosphate isomerase-like protein (cupin superfamily)